MKKIEIFVSIPLVLSAFLWVMAFSPAWAMDLPRITPEELKKMIEKGDQDFLVVDVQPRTVYDLGHIKGAVSLPWEKEIKGPVTLPQDKLLILYCDCGQEEDALDMGKQLMENWDYMNIKVLEGGWSQWKILGYPIEKNRE